MKTQAINNETAAVKNNPVITSVLCGTLAAGAEKLLLPAEAKAALKNTRAGQDAFLKKAEKCAVKTMKNTGKTFDLNVIKENAKNMYPQMQETASIARKKIGKTFIGAAGIVLAAKVAAGMIMKHKQNQIEK